MKYLSLLTAAVSASLVGEALAATHTYDWTAGWGSAAPDGYNKSIITCNGEFPWPAIRVREGDRVIINLHNGLGNQNTSMHFHGLFQRGTNQFDGVPMLTQCEIPPNETLTYNFTVPEQTGMFWYHSHSSGQYMEGMRGMFLIDPAEEMPFDYDEEVSLSVSDWYHESVPALTARFLNKNNPTGAEPIPQNLLFNDSMNSSWSVEPDRTYLLRIVNIGGFVSQYLWLEDHTMTVVGVDGVYVEPNETDYIYMTVAQRYDVLIHTKNDTDRNYAFMQKMDEDMLDTLVGALHINATNQIIYDSSNDNATEYTVDDLYDNFLDDFYLRPVSGDDLYEDFDYRISVDVSMNNLLDGKNYAFFNNITYVQPKVPTLGTVLSAPSNLFSTSNIYGPNTHPFILQRGEIVEIVVNNNDGGTHPFHLHGHIFQVVERGPDFGDAPAPVNWNASAPYEAPEHPMMRDTIYLRPQSWFRIRFRADNPGVWFFHCHIEWHLLQGLGLTLIEDPSSLRQNQNNLTSNWRDVCSSAGTPVAGNAAAHTEDFNDLSGQNLQVKDLPSGFTARGIVALVFSCIAGVLGCIAIGIYGMADIPNIEQKVFDDLSPEERAVMNAEEDDDDEEEEQSSSSGSAAGAKESAAPVSEKTRN